MNIEEQFMQRAKEAEERAAGAAPHSEERRVWTGIAAEYRQFAKDAAQGKPLMKAAKS